nr:M48 family metallopeptidase [Actinomadura nitritigenes]
MPPNVEVRRSTRRRRTVSAYRDGDKVVVMVPSRLSKAEEEQWIATILERLEERERRRRPSDAALESRAHELSRRYLDGRADPVSVRWVANQRTRWGSCTPDDGTIRLSTRLRGMPSWVVDYVLIHELAHLLIPGHGADFWQLVGNYPKADRARGYLEGVAAAAHLPLEADAPDEEPAHDDGMHHGDGLHGDGFPHEVAG